MKRKDLKEIPNGELLRQGIRKLLVNGVPENIFDTSVRIVDYKNDSNGKKAHWVRNITLDLNIQERIY